MSISEEFPLLEKDNSPQENPVESAALPDLSKVKQQKPKDFWLRLGLQVLMIVVVAIFGLAIRHYLLDANLAKLELPQQAALAAPVAEIAMEASLAQEGSEVTLPAFNLSDIFSLGIPRFANLYTTIPSRPRVDVITYTVQAGDTVFGIADSYGLRPETIFWGNQEVLNDDPHKLFPGQVLNILPVDGVYHKWSEGEDISRVAEFYGIEYQKIVEWPGNRLDVFEFDSENPGIDAGTWLIIPEGAREFVDFGPPRITRANPAVARTYGPGHCGSIADGAVGVGAFIWPTTATYLSGYDYNPAANHSGIDIAGDTGNPIYAADSGVVVYAGWSYFGYGNLVVIDHGNWQTLYAHLSDFYVTCGQSVFQGTTIAALGNTGNSSGSHLHFELMYQSAKVNPWDYMSP